MAEEAKKKSYTWFTVARGLASLVIFAYSISRLVAILTPPAPPMLPAVHLEPTAGDDTSDPGELMSVTIDDGDGGTSVWVRHRDSYRAKPGAVP